MFISKNFKGVSCKSCVLQFRYHAGNNFGTSKEGKSCLGCAEEQEEIYNCADIEIIQNMNKLIRIQETLNSTEEILLKSDSNINNNSHILTITQIDKYFYAFILTFIIFRLQDSAFSI